MSSGTSYYYRIRASNAAGASANSNWNSATTLGVAPAVTIIPQGSSWKYLDNGTNQGTGWRTTTFVDTSWASGNAQLGYGDGDEATVVSYGPNINNKYITTYFRKSFTVANAAAFSALELRLLRDDGAVVYLNGIEINRNNMPVGTIAYNTLASATVGGADESFWYINSIASPYLRTGTNVIAVEIHQSDVTSSDISFDLQLLATPMPPPPPLSAPSGLQAAAITGSQINLTWIDTVSNETGFKIERSTNGTVFSQIGAVAANVNLYVDTGLSSATQYWYRVRATNASGDSYFTAVAKATTLTPVAPDMLGPGVAPNSTLSSGPAVISVYDTSASVGLTGGSDDAGQWDASAMGNWSSASAHGNWAWLAEWMSSRRRSEPVG